MKHVEINNDYMRGLIRSDIVNSGLTQEGWAQHRGFSASFISDVLQGRRDVTESLATAMGYERKVIFVRTRRG